MATMLPGGHRPTNQISPPSWPACS